MIDIHCHILPGVDDGAKSLDEAIRMAQTAWKDGITDIIATPHTHNGIYVNWRDDILHAVESFQQVLERQHIPIHIHPGAEIHIHEHLLDHLRSAKLATMSNHVRFLLLELPFMHLPKFTDDVIASLIEEGVTPIIAHPERIEPLKNRPERLALWIEQGAIAQVTASSVTRKRNSSVKKRAEQLIREQLIHLVASDGHDNVNRKVELSHAYAVIEKLSKGASERFQQNAAAILRGDTIPFAKPLLTRPKKKWLLF
ncbi:MAG: tyrosine-protein phosphatase [Clostridia bacterium]